MIFEAGKGTKKQPRMTRIFAKKFSITSVIDAGFGQFSRLEVFFKSAQPFFAIVEIFFCSFFGIMYNKFLFFAFPNNIKRSVLVLFADSSFLQFFGFTFYSCSNNIFVFSSLKRLNIFIGQQTGVCNNNSFCLLLIVKFSSPSP